MCNQPETPDMPAQQSLLEEDSPNIKEQGHWSPCLNCRDPTCGRLREAIVRTVIAPLAKGPVA